MRRVARAIVGGALVATALALAGCGGAIQNDELGRGIKSLGSDAAEGALVADGVVRDRTKASFVRVQSRTLADDADHEAQKLEDADAAPGNARQLERAVELAGKISTALGDLETSPRDAEAARATKAELERLSDRADRLGKTL
jgi:hypothetical protein